MMELDALAQFEPTALVPANPQLLNGLPFGVLQFHHRAAQPLHYKHKHYKHYSSSSRTAQSQQHANCSTKGGGCAGTDLAGGPGPGVGTGENPVDLHLLLLVLAFTLGLTAGVGGSMFVGWRCGVVVLGSVV